MRRAVGLFGLVALGLVACGSRTPLPTGAGRDPLAFPLGTYTRCAQGERGSEPNVFVGSVGVSPDGTLEVTGSGPDLHAYYTDLNGTLTELEFTALTSRTATGVAGQSLGGFTGRCVQGIGVDDQIPFTATMQVQHATMTWAGGAIFVAVRGSVTGDGGPCGTLSETATRWITCRAGPPVVPPLAAAPAPSKIPSSYVCSTQVATFYETGGGAQILSSGGEGNDVDVGGALDAKASGPWLAGAFTLAPETATVATTTGTAETPCQVPVQTHGSDATLEPLDVRGLVVDGDGSEALVLFSGVMGAGASCAGAEKAGALFCAKR
jgi:hypothetical protein